MITLQLLGKGGLESGLRRGALGALAGLWRRFRVGVGVGVGDARRRAQRQSALLVPEKVWDSTTVIVSVTMLEPVTPPAISGVDYHSTLTPVAPI